MSLGPNAVVQHTEGNNGERGNAIELRVIDDGLASVIPASTDVPFRPVDSSMMDEQLQGLGVSGKNEIMLHESCSSGTGPGESRSWGRCAPMSHQVPGLSVIASTSRRSDDASPEGRPSEVQHPNVESVNGMQLETSSIGGEADMCAGGGSYPEVIKLEDTRARATAMEPRSSA